MAEQRLIDVNPLVKGMKGRLKSYEKEYGYLSDFVSGYEEAIDDVVDTPTVEAKQVEWISVKDRLPEYNKYVLVYTKMGYMDVDFNKSSFSANFYRNNRDVTHWMPLPEPPKGE